jgi:uroporphyrin-3 C-methyltransferase
MNTETPLTESPALAGTPGRNAKGSGTGLAWLALALALAALCAAAWTWWQGQHASRDQATQAADELQRLGQRLADFDARSGKMESRLADMAAADPGQRLDRIEQDVGALQEAARQWESAQQESAAWSRSMQAVVENNQLRLAGLEARLVKLSARSMDSSAELDLDEIDYLLRMAQERLQLFADAKNAARALELADAHIAAFDRPLYAGLRHELSLARQRIASLSLPDVQLLNDKMDMLQGGLAELPFKGETGAATGSAATADPGWWARIRNAFASLVTVRHTAVEEDQVPVLADQELIRQGAWLQLELARYAVVRRDQPAYDAALRKLSAALQRWFEPSGQHGQGVTALLAELQAVNIAPTLPDISAPWLALRALRDAGAAAPAADAPAPEAGDAPPQAPDGAQTGQAGSGEIAE